MKKVVFATALKAKASALILAHNHASGNLKSSKTDEGLTLRFKEAGNVLDIAITDHLIINPDSYYSFATEGIL